MDQAYGGKEEDFSFFDDNSLNDFEQSLASSGYLFPPEQSDLFGHFETFENFGSSTLTMPSFESTLSAKANNSVSDSFFPSSSTTTLTSASYHDKEQVNEVSGSADVLSLQPWEGNTLDGGDGCNDLFTAFDDMSDFSSCPTLNSLSSSVNMDLPRFNSLKVVNQFSPLMEPVFSSSLQNCTTATTSFATPSINITTTISNLQTQVDHVQQKRLRKIFSRKRKQLDARQQQHKKEKETAEEQNLSISSTLPTFKCRRCPPELNSIFSSKTELRLHIAKAHHEHSRASSSAKAPKEPKQPKVKEKDIKYYDCNMPNCTYFSNRASSVRRHMMSHSDETPYVCGVCGKKYKSSSGFRRHVDKFHQEKEQKPKVENSVVIQGQPSLQITFADAETKSKFMETLSSGQEDPSIIMSLQGLF